MLMETFNDTLVSTADAEAALDHEDRVEELRMLFSKRSVGSFANGMEGLTVSVSKEMWSKRLDTVSEIGTRVLFNSGRMTEDMDSADIHVSIGAIFDNRRVQFSKSGKEIIRMTDKEILGSMSNGNIRSEMERMRELWKNAVKHDRDGGRPGSGS